LKESFGAKILTGGPYCGCTGRELSTRRRLDKKSCKSASYCSANGHILDSTISKGTPLLLFLRGFKVIGYIMSAETLIFDWNLPKQQNEYGIRAIMTISDITNLTYKFMKLILA
jgi:hypothetical protein